jgi:hypothetical protein
MEGRGEALRGLTVEGELEGGLDDEHLLLLGHDGGGGRE